MSDHKPGLIVKPAKFEENIIFGGKMSKQNILDSDNEDEVVESFRVNKKYAKTFEKVRKTQDLARAKRLELFDDEDDDLSSDESEDDDAAQLSSNLELQIIKTINSIRKKDPKVYDKDQIWFQSTGDDDDDEDEDENDEVSKKKRYKDVLREQLLQDGAKADDKDDHDTYVDITTTRPKHRLVYNQEQDDLRKQFLKSVAGDHGHDDDDHDDDGLLTVKPKTADDIIRERQEIASALQEMKQLGATSSSATKMYSSSSGEEAVDVDDFLSKYITQQKWRDHDTSSDDHQISSSSSSQKMIPDDDMVEVDADEEEFDAAEEFESRYNFRFEELQGKEGGSSHALEDLQVTGHARQVGGSLRRVDDKRKIQRQLQRERKEKEKRQKEAEMRRLKNLKRQELQERLKKIGEIGGLHELGIDEAVLDEEWDPAQHDAMMAQQYGNDYYDVANDDGVDISEEANQWLLEEGDYNGDGDEHDAADNPVYPSSTSTKAGKHVKDIDIEELLASTSKHNTSSSAQAARSMLDELYQLDYEDIVSGIPCRFKYKDVEPEDFGLTTDDILMADDAELNNVVSLRRLSAYYDRELSQEERQKIAKRRKKLRQMLKERKVVEVDLVSANAAQSHYQPAKTVAAVEKHKIVVESSSAEPSKKRKRHKKRSGTEGNDDGNDHNYLISSQEAEGHGDAHVEDDMEVEEVGESQEKKKKNNKKKNRAPKELSEQQKRLALYQ